MIDCALITDDETFRRHVTRLVRGPESSDRLVFEASQAAASLPRDKVADILASNPAIVFIDLGESLTGLRVVELLNQDAPDMILVAAGPSLPADSLLKVMRAGAAEYLPRPLSAEDIEQAFQRVRRRVSGVRGDEGQVRGEITTLFSPKGGVGVTTLAVNLAINLHDLTGESTILLDLSTSLGTAALTMGLQPRYSYLDVIKNFHRLDEELFRSFLDIHETGVRVLASPPRAENPGGPTMDEAQGLLRLCRKHFAFVVVDGGHTLTDAADVALMEADHKLWVSTPELPTLRNLKRTLELVATHGATNGKSPHRVLLNQYADGLGMSVDEVKKGLGLSVDLVIDRAVPLVPESINLGQPAVTLRRSAFKKSIDDLTVRVAGRSRVALRRGGFMQALMRPFRSSGPAAGTDSKENDR